MIATNGELIIHRKGKKITCTLEGGPIFYFPNRWILDDFVILNKKGKLEEISGILTKQLAEDPSRDALYCVSKEWRWWWIMPAYVWINKKYWRFKNWSIYQLHRIGLAEREFACWPQWREIKFIGYLYNKFRSLYEKIQRQA